VIQPQPRPGADRLGRLGRLRRLAPRSTLAPTWLRRPAGTERATERTRPLFDEEFLARLRHLVLLSRRTVSAGLAGERRSHRRGASPEFSDFKMYTPGDDYRRIDWNTYARLDQLFVRESETTTEFDVHILVDVSRSMDWRSDGELPTKLEYALRVAGAFGYLSLWHFDRTTVTPFGAALAPAFGPVQGRANIVPLLRFLEGVRTEETTDVAAVLSAYVRPRRRAGVLVLLSDLLAGEPADLLSPLRDARGRGWQVTLIQVSDPAEENPARLDAGDAVLELIDQESHLRQRVRPTARVHAAYQEARAAWQDGIAEVCAATSVAHVAARTDEPIETALMHRLGELGVVG
jgi:uncharacterized protein (DUF58 family)